MNGRMFRFSSSTLFIIPGVVTILPSGKVVISNLRFNSSSVGSVTCGI
jgi:uncharacterized membrane protein